jgi:hypothetical protein
MSDSWKTSPMNALKTDSSSHVGGGGLIPAREAPVQRQRMLCITRSGTEL